MGNKLYVANIERSLTDEQLQELFGQVGELVVEETRIIRDRETGKSRGFGFVSYANKADADQAIEKLNGYELNGRELVVTEARPQQPRTDRYAG